MQRTKWKASYSTQFADIVAVESADAVGVAKGVQKGLEAVDNGNELLLKENLSHVSGTNKELQYFQ